MYKFVENVEAGLFLEQAKDLLQMHWEELALNKDKVFLQPDVSRYKQLQDINILHNIVVYKDDVVVGYSVLMTQPHIHYKESVFCNVDVVYVHPEHRKGVVGARLLISTEQMAKKLGAHVILHHAKPYVPNIIRPLEKLGYNLYEHIYGKYIGE